jgi:lipid-A-disaccharide synthase
MKKIFIIAGEASGDSHAGEAVNKLKKLNSDVKYYGIGGHNLEKQGVELIFPYKDVNYIGFTAVLKNLSAIKKKLRKAVEKVRELDPDIIILVDFPGFNISFAEEVRKFYKGKIVYYISPQVWAWHKERVKKIKRLAGDMLVVFPFEVDFYRKEGMEAKFVGHPLVEKIDEFISQHPSPIKSGKTITLLPGSRLEEIKRILPGLLKASKKLQEEIGADIKIICPPHLDISFYDEFIKGYDVEIVKDDENKSIYYNVLYNSDLVFTKAGTTTMECTLLGTPFCVTYKAGTINYIIGKSMIKVDHVAMPNILMGKEIVKEFIQGDMTQENLYNEGKKILTDEKYRSEMINNFSQVRKLLTDRSASGTVAEIINSML